jgi:2-phosphosulfolactate phosphatase
VVSYALNNGAKSVIPVKTIEEALEIKKHFPDYLLAGERHSEKIEGFDFGNSPFEFTKSNVAGKNIISTTTNGTKAVNMVQNSEEIIAGSYLNTKTVLNYLKNKKNDIFLICSGTNGKVSMEDVLFAGLLSSNLRGNFRLGDSARVGKEIYDIHKDNLQNFILNNSEHAGVLLSKNKFDDIELCGKIDVVEILPVWRFKDRSFGREKV